MHALHGAAGAPLLSEVLAVGTPQVPFFEAVQAAPPLVSLTQL